MTTKFQIENQNTDPPFVEGAGSFTLKSNSEALIASVLPFCATLGQLDYDRLPQEITQQIEDNFSDEATIIGLMTTHARLAVLLIREAPGQDDPDLVQFISVFGENVLSKLAAAGIRFINL